LLRKTQIVGIIFLGGKMKNKIPEPYELKNTCIGWWIDGYCGYLYVGYFDTKSEAIEAFWKKFGSEE